MANDIENIESAKPTDLSLYKAPVQDLPPITKAGVNLFKFVMGVTLAFLATAIIGYAIREYTIISTLRTLKDNPQIISVMDNLHADIGEFRKFWMDLVQMVLINALLPILTALLGYIFGTKQT